MPSSPPPRVLIAGAGAVGIAAGLRLAADGAEVHALRRSPGRIPAPLRPLVADLTESAALGAVLDGPYDLVAITTSADGRDEAAYRAAYVDGTTNLLTVLARSQPAPRLVAFTSSSGVHAQSSGEEVDEHSPAEPTSVTGRVLREAEDLLAAHPWRTCVLRLTGIYGPGRTRLLDQAREGAVVSSRPHWTNRIHVTDAARALVHVLGLSDPAPCYVVTDDEPALRLDVLAWLADGLGAVAPRQDADAPSRGGAGKRMRNDRLVASGWRPAHPNFRTGYAELLHGR